MWQIPNRLLGTPSKRVRKEASLMRRFKVAVFEENGRWFFRWWNMGAPTAQGLEGPFNQEKAARDAEQRFMDEEKEKFWWTTFEPAS